MHIYVYCICPANAIKVTLQRRKEEEKEGGGKERDKERFTQKRHALSYTIILSHEQESTVSCIEGPIMQTR